MRALRVQSVQGNFRTIGVSEVWILDHECLWRLVIALASTSDEPENPNESAEHRRIDIRAWRTAGRRWWSDLSDIKA